MCDMQMFHDFSFIFFKLIFNINLKLILRLNVLTNFKNILKIILIIIIKLFPKYEYL